MAGAGVLGLAVARRRHFCMLYIISIKTEISKKIQAALLLLLRCAQVVCCICCSVYLPTERGVCRYQLMSTAVTEELCNKESGGGREVERERDSGACA